MCVYPLKVTLNICTHSFNFLDDDICMFQSKWRVLLLGDFSAVFGKSNDINDLIGMFWNFVAIVTIMC